MVPTIGGPDSDPDEETTIHHLDDVGNFLKICIFPISNIV
jgi:hypothetical protein